MDDLDDFITYTLEQLEKERKPKMEAAIKVDELFEARLKKIEQRIAKAEDDGLRARWEFGQEILMQRVGKLLPRGLLDKICADFDVSRSEIKRRVQFAERFPTEKQLAHACASWPTWFQMTQEGLDETGNFIGKETKNGSGDKS